MTRFSISTAWQGGRNTALAAGTVAWSVSAAPSTKFVPLLAAAPEAFAVSLRAVADPSDGAAVLLLGLGSCFTDCSSVGSKIVDSGTALGAPVMTSSGRNSGRLLPSLGTSGGSRKS